MHHKLKLISLFLLSLFSAQMIFSSEFTVDFLTQKIPNTALNNDFQSSIRYAVSEKYKDTMFDTDTIRGKLFVSGWIASMLNPLNIMFSPYFLWGGFLVELPALGVALAASALGVIPFAGPIVVTSLYTILGIIFLPFLALYISLPLLIVGCLQTGAIVLEFVSAKFKKRKTLTGISTQNHHKMNVTFKLSFTI